MCFNLFGPLVRDGALATCLARALWGDRVARVRRVALEWAPQPAQAYLDDRTAFDAFVELELAGGGLGFVGVETKLTEPFSRRRDDGPRYRRWMEAPGAPWRPEAGDRVADVAHNQLWRDHLLAWSMLARAGSPYRWGCLLLVSHPEDRSCARTVARYRELLRPEDDTFQARDLGAVVQAWRAALGLDDPHRAWLDAFATRYLDLARSRDAWRRVRGGRA